ncbi:MAG: fructokinase [Coxiella sp. RIFCSPHIGHO2_12_FULL_42_15]|nr:MAG: fructokinase [Coxiella sp. RIFCSPHIGHO2_12_FULL_42_15]
MTTLFGGIEAGGTKFICGIADQNGKIKDNIRIPTNTPETTLVRVVDYFKKIHQETPLKAIGIASFGPIDPDPASPFYGYITSTPKPGWGQFNLVGAIKKHFALPIRFDTDVNAAALGEGTFGAAKGLNTYIYITVGTGIGAGGVIEGNLMHGLTHPEMGHIFIPQHKDDDFAGVCPFHKNCLEGLASGPSLKTRWKVNSALDLPVDHKAWEIEADYLATMIANYIMILSPQRIIIGGGVMRQKQLYTLIRPLVLKKLNGYIKHDTLQDHIDEYIVPPALGDSSGLLGAVALAQEDIT